MRIPSLIRRNDVRIFLVAAAFAVPAFATVVAIAADPGAGAANVGDVKSNEPIRRAPPTAQAPTNIVERELPKLPYVYRDAFLLVPAGTPSDNSPTEYGDERDMWMWQNGSAVSIDLLPDDELVRIPEVPSNYELAEVTWTAGIRADGSFGGLIDINFVYGAPDLLPLSVSIGTPLRTADGEPLTKDVPDVDSGILLRMVDVAGRPAIYEFPDPELDLSGKQLLTVRDGSLLLIVNAYRGVAYETMLAIAESMLDGGVR